MEIIHSGESIDISEEWDPSEEDGLKFLQENNEPGRYPKHIIIQNRIGYMIMPGIYYFGENACEVCQNTNLGEDACGICRDTKIEPIHCSRKIAILSQGNLFLHLLLYLAVDETNIEYLYKIQSRLGVYSYSIYENKPPLSSEAQMENEGWFSFYIPDNFYEPNADFYNFDCIDEDCGTSEVTENPSDEFSGNALTPQEDVSEQPVVESTAEELMPGLGIRDICLCFKRYFLPGIKMRRYEYAHKSGDKLVLINSKDYLAYPFHLYFTVPTKKGREEYSLCFMEELTVCRREVLHCGLPINRLYFLIDRIM